MNNPEPIEPKKPNITYTKDDSNLKVGFSGWGRSNELQTNNMTSIKPTQLQQNQLPQVPIVQAEEKKIEIVEGIPLTEEELRQLTEEELKQLLSNSSDAQIRAILEKSPPQTRTMVRNILDEMKPGDSLDKIYNEYVEAYIQYYGDDEYLTKNAWNGKGRKIESKQWGRKRSDITDLIKKYGTFQEEDRQREEQDRKKKEQQARKKLEKEEQERKKKEEQERKKENERDKEVKKEELGLMGIEDKLSKTYRTYLKNLPKQIEQERKAASKVNIEKITGPNVKEKVVAIETSKN